MERGNTKQDILAAALDLFSVNGFEGTSLSMIAEAVGIRKASLYSHFDSKQAILDALVENVLEQYNRRSLFARTDPTTLFGEGEQPMTAEGAAELIRQQLRYILHDPYIRKARKMLTIEQFRNQELARLQTKQNYTDVLNFFTGLMDRLTRQGVLRKEDPRIMAAQFCLPVTVWINLCDREPEQEEEVMELVGDHVRQFFRVYGPEDE